MKRKFGLLVFLLLSSQLCWSTTVVTPNTIYKGETATTTTNDVMINQKAITSNIEIMFTEPDMKKCKRVGSVRTTNPIEMWQKSDACVIRHMELKRQAVLMKGSQFL